MKSPGEELFHTLQLSDALQVPEDWIQRRRSLQTAPAELLHLSTPAETREEKVHVNPIVPKATPDLSGPCRT